MADASCSSGTPFKRLIDHQGRDASHQQDRLMSGGSAHGHGAFRSTLQPTQGQDGFGAFMNSPLALPGMPHHPAGRLAAHAAVLEPSHHPAFATQPPPQHQARASPVPDMSNWAADFGRFQGSGPPIASQPSTSRLQINRPPPQMNSQAAFSQPSNSFAPLYGPTNGGFMDFNTALSQRPAAEADFDQEMSRWMASHGDGRGMEDVDAVMDQMARQLELNDAAFDETGATAQDTQVNEAYLDEISKAADLDTMPTQDLPLETQGQDVPTEQHEDPKGKSDVAEAAERLLESVGHEESEKWKNSAFLALMRDFRDGRKDIIDNEIRETAEPETDAKAQN